MRDINSLLTKCLDEFAIPEKLITLLNKEITPLLEYSRFSVPVRITKTKNYGSWRCWTKISDVLKTLNIAIK
jgi:hypothetical protein